jgi:hypothetical protein
MFDLNRTTFGVSNFVLDSCSINGNSGSQLGLRFQYFDGNLTILNSDFTSVGWGIIVRKKFFLIFFIFFLSS